MRVADPRERTKPRSVSTASLSAILETEDDPITRELLQLVLDWLSAKATEKRGGFIALGEVKFNQHSFVISPFLYCTGVRYSYLQGSFSDNEPPLISIHILIPLMFRRHQSVSMYSTVQVVLHDLFVGTMPQVPRLRICRSGRAELSLTTTIFL